jgi:hypothetical protein
MNADDAAYSISLYYRDDFAQLINSVLQPTEEIFWAGNAAVLSDPRRFGYFLVSSFRIISVQFVVKFGFFSARKSLDLTSPDASSYTAGAGAPPETPLHPAERASRWLFDQPLKNLLSVSRLDLRYRFGGWLPEYLAGLGGRDFEARCSTFGLSLQFLGGGVFGPLFFYTPKPGQAVYDILQQHFGRARGEGSSIVDRLERLARLRSKGELTAAEYEEAKRHLLREE